MTTIKERISQLPGILNVRKGIFFKEINVASSGFRGKGLCGDVSSDVTVRIIKAYPAVDTTWLLLGEGSPIKELRHTSQSISNQGNLILGQGHITPEANTSQIIELLLTQIDDYRSQNDYLKEKLDQAQDTISLILKSK